MSGSRDTSRPTQTKKIKGEHNLVKDKRVDRERENQLVRLVLAGKGEQKNQPCRDDPGRKKEILRAENRGGEYRLT